MLYAVCCMLCVAHGGVRQRDELAPRDAADPEPRHPDGAGHGRAPEEDVQRDADGRARALEARLLVQEPYSFPKVSALTRYGTGH